MMNMLRKTLLFALLALLSGLASAAWWEFGRAEGEPAITDLKLNRVDVFRAEDVVILTREDLDGGVLTLRGRAEVGRGLIGLVEVSLDGGDTWTKAVLGEKGRFTFEFRPDLEKEYAFRIRAITTVGQKSDVEDHSFYLRVSAANPQEAVRQAFLQLLRAYMEENRPAFMALVSEDFEGNLSALEDALSDDFRFLDNIRIEPNITRVAQFDRTYEVYFTFNRQVQSRSGQILRDAAASVAGFVQEGGGFKLSRLAAPLIFGLSGASEIATSVTEQSVGSAVITLNPTTGDATTATQGSLPGGSGAGVQTGVETLHYVNFNNYQGYAFDTDTVTAENGALPEVGDFRVEINMLWLKAGNQAQIVPGTFAGVTQAPLGGYGGPNIGINAGDLVAFKLMGPKYALIEVQSITALGGGAFNITFRFKYQPNGSRNF